MNIRPAGQIWASSALDAEIGINCVGTGTSVPSVVQLELIRTLRTSIWMGMSSYGLHLANLAELNGLDLTASAVTKVITSAEPLAAAKRAKLEHAWGACAFDVFGMGEAGHMGSESVAGEGLHVWTGMHLVEVLGDATGESVAEGERGAPVVTPLWISNTTPFRQWKSGDIVSYRERGATGEPFAVFPLIKHAHRTTEFFKVRGVNINHTEFADFMLRMPDIGDFECECVATAGNDQLRVSIEARGSADPAPIASKAAHDLRAAFELRPEIFVLPRGSLAREFEASTEAPRFVDRR